MTLARPEVLYPERPQGGLPLRPSAIHSREGGTLMKRPPEDAALRRAQRAMR
jgi:hypothetical protein